jgi:hypothetical protein
LRSTFEVTVSTTHSWKEVCLVSDNQLFPPLPIQVPCLSPSYLQNDHPPFYVKTTCEVAMFLPVGCWVPLQKSHIPGRCQKSHKNSVVSKFIESKTLVTNFIWTSHLCPSLVYAPHFYGSLHVPCPIPS